MKLIDIFKFEDQNAYSLIFISSEKSKSCKRVTSKKSQPFNFLFIIISKVKNHISHRGNGFLRLSYLISCLDLLHLHRLFYRRSNQILLTL
jgi:hypothetical protein